MKNICLIGFFLLIFAPAGYICCTGSAQKKSDNKILPVKVQELKTEINFGAGELNISSSPVKQPEVTYETSKDEWKPVISFNDENPIGYLKIAPAGNNESLNFDSLDNCQWNIKLSNTVKNDITVKCAAGEGNIDLHDCNLKRFDFSMAAGEIKIDLSNSSVPNLWFKAFAGNAEIDLSGNWKNDLNASIKCGVGEITLILPSHTGTRINIVGILGEIDAPGFTKQKKVYTNSLYGKTSETIYIDLAGGIGNVTIKMVD